MNYFNRHSIINFTNDGNHLNRPPETREATCSKEYCWNPVSQGHEYCDSCERSIEEQIEIEQFEKENA